MRPRNKEPIVEEEVDPTAWLLTNVIAEFLLLHTNEIKYMCMFGYTFYHGCNVFKTFRDEPFSYKFVSMIFACTGGGTLVPIFINSIPVSLAQDAYPIAIMASFLLHSFFPVLRQVVDLSPLLKAAIIVLYETLRASVVVKLTSAAATAIAPSEFEIPLFGPIFCGAIGGCGGAFLPLNKGLDPIRKGLAPNMMTALVAATFFHLFTSYFSDSVIDAKKKAHLMVAQFFVAFGLIKALHLLDKKEEKTEEKSGVKTRSQMKKEK